MIWYNEFLSVKPEVMDKENIDKYIFGAKTFLERILQELVL